jgi:ribonuclease PH
VALAQALYGLRRKSLLNGAPLKGLVAATSVGLVASAPCLDLSYVEDSQADVDMNVVRTDAGRFVEIQGTAEKAPFSQEQMLVLLGLAAEGIETLFQAQRAVLTEALPSLLPRP